MKKGHILILAIFLSFLFLFSYKSNAFAQCIPDGGACSGFSAACCSGEACNITGTECSFDPHLGEICVGTGNCPAAGAPIPCEVTTSPSVHNLTIGGTGSVTAVVSSGLGSATVNQMRFGSYNTAVASVSPTSDGASPYSTIITGVAAGATAVWATADLSDGRTCQSTGTTDTDVNVSSSPQANLYVNTLVLRRNAVPANCSNGTIVTSGTTVSHGEVLEVCINGGNNGSVATGNYYISNFVNQPSQPAYGVNTFQTYGPFTQGVGGLPYSQIGSITANSSTCSTNCRAAVFIDDGSTPATSNLVPESNESDNFTTSVFYNVSGGPITNTPTPTGTLTPTPTGTLTPSPTTGPGTPTPTPAFTISGTVFVDANGDHFSDPGEGYNGATITHSRGGSTTTNSSGSYTFNVPQVNHDVTLTLPSGYVAVTQNPALGVMPNATVNFEIINNPQCADGADNNGNGLIDSQEPGCYDDGDPDDDDDGIIDPIDPDDDNDGIPDVSDPDWPGDTYNPADPNENPDCSDGIDNDGDGFSDRDDPGCHNDGNPGNPDSYEPDWPSESLVKILTGKVYLDSGANNCASGTADYTAGAVISTRRPQGFITDTDTSGPTGVYAIGDFAPAGDRTAEISNISGYRVRRIKFDGGAWTTAFTAYTYGPFNFSANHTLDWCISNISSWIQTTNGDVRMNNLVNKIPAGLNASTDASNPSVFFSSSFSSIFAPGGVSAKGWKVESEYSTQSDSKNRNGSMSYSFYMNRIAQQNVTTENVPGCPASGDCSTGLIIPSGALKAYYLNNGNLTISSYSQPAGTRILILVNGNVTITNNIAVPTGSLLIIAAKGDINIDKTIGTTTLSDTASTQVNGILSAQGDIVVQGDGCPSGAPDKRLNLAGALIANSLKPFEATVDGGGLVNQRSLCVQDNTYPSLYVKSRYDFVTQLTDFYKTAYTRWREIAP